MSKAFLFTYDPVFWVLTGMVIFGIGLMFFVVSKDKKS